MDLRGSLFKTQPKFDDYSFTKTVKDPRKPIRICRKIYFVLMSVRMTAATAEIISAIGKMVALS